jgi:hypothetical protein
MAQFRLNFPAARRVLSRRRMSTSNRTKRRVVLDRVFSTPHNWCDRLCERCPLFDECGVPHFDLQARLEARARGEDPDDVLRAADRATEELEAVLGDAASSVDSPDEEPCAPELGVDPETLEEAGFALVLVTPVAARVAGGGRTVPILLAALKSARVACLMTVGGGETWKQDVVPNLMLLEDSRAKVAQLLTEIVDPGGGLARAFVRWCDVVEPLLASIDDEAREAMDALVRQRAAPSPFCVVEATRRES